MNQEWKTKWLEALRSGKYKQGQYRLKDGDKFCCLGVLCDLVESDWSEGDCWNGYSIETIRGYTTLPKEVENKTDIDSFFPTALADMNDRGTLFLKIADYIEKNL